MRYCVSPACASRLLLVMLGLVVDQRFGAQQIGNAGRHVADLGARCLGMPARQQRAVEAAGASSISRLARISPVRPSSWLRPEQPVERHLVLGGDVEQRLGARQARRGAGQQLRQRRAVDADRRRESRLVQIGTVHQHLQTLAERLSTGRACPFVTPLGE